MAYRFTIHTDKYKDRRCSPKNWEGGTMNDYMHAINGLKFREDNLRDLRYRIYFFAGHGEYSDEYNEWLNKRSKRNTITYRDNMCDMDRTQKVTAYGIPQGYFNVDKVIDKVKKEGIAKIPFSYFYDGRQYLYNMDGCYIEIEKI